MTTINIYMDIDKLRSRAQHKLGLSSEKAPFNKEQIRRVLAKREPLTEADVAQLTHFVGKTTRELSRTIYYGNTIIDPATWDHQLYRRNSQGEYVTTSIGENNRKKSQKDK